MDYTVGTRELPSRLEVREPRAVASLFSELRHAEIEVMTLLPVAPDLMAGEVQTVAVGSMMSVTVEARNIFSGAVRADDGRGIVIVHNHAFQRKAYPSEGDQEFLHGIKQAGGILGVPILDSIVIGEEEYHSSLEHGIHFEKREKYASFEKRAGLSHAFDSISSERKEVIASAEKAAALVPFLRKQPDLQTVVIHLTPDLEVGRIEAMKSRLFSPMEEARIILRSAITSPSTKYLVLVNNDLHRDHRAQYDDELLDRTGLLRLGATVLCIPLVDVICLGKKETYSFAEHGRIFPKTKSYVVPENEGLRLKGPPRTRRADLPPYSWTFR